MDRGGVVGDGQAVIDVGLACEPVKGFHVKGWV